MSYKYCIKISLKSGKEDKKLLLDIKFMYLKLKRRSFFPTFGKICTSDVEGYGSGVKGIFFSELKLLTNQFPNQIFIVYFFYWNCTNLDVFEVKNTNIEPIYHMNTEDIKLLNHSIFGIALDPTTLQLPSDYIELVDLYK